MEAPNQRSRNSLPARRQSLDGSAKISMIERTIFKEASIPSPLAHESIGRRINHDGHPKALEETYHHIIRQKHQLLARIRSQDNFTDGKGLLCWLEYAHAPRGNRSQGLGSVGRFPRNVKYAWLRQLTQLGLSSQTPEATSEVESASAASSVFAVIRQEPPQAGGDYIIDTRDQISLSINGVPVGINSRVRRFPDFAVIEADGNFFFWWRTQIAMNFIPKNVGQKRPFEGSQHYENLYEELPPVKRSKISSNESSRVFSRPFMRNPRLDSIPKKTQWWDKLNQGLERHRRALREEGNPPQKDTVEKPNPLEKLPRDIYDYQGLWDDQIMMSIGVVWDALRQDDIFFAIADEKTLQICRERRDEYIQGPRSALGPNDFIIPLSFGTDYLGHIGHHLLAVAQVTDKGPIKIKLMNSSPGRIAEQHIRAALAGIVMYSGWLGKNGTRPLMVWPMIEFTDVLVPEQELRNACGLNVVLNAWAEMLNISINEQRDRVKPCKEGQEEADESADFLSQTIEIIDLALLGHMDTETILAFMISYGYAKVGIPLNPEDRSGANYVPQLELRPLTTSIGDLIDRVNDAVTPSRFDDSYYPNVPNQDDLRFLMKEARCSEQVASKALKDSNGDMRIARWFIPVPWNGAQKVKSLIKATTCSAEEAERALYLASGNSRLAPLWVKAARKGREEEIKRLESDKKIQEDKLIRQEEGREDEQQIVEAEQEEAQLQMALARSLLEPSVPSPSSASPLSMTSPRSPKSGFSGNEITWDISESNSEEEEDVKQAVVESLRLEEEKQIDKAVELSLLESAVPTPKSDFSGDESIVPISSDEDSDSEPSSESGVVG